MLSGVQNDWGHNYFISSDHIPVTMAMPCSVASFSHYSMARSKTADADLDGSDG